MQENSVYAGAMCRNDVEISSSDRGMRWVSSRLADGLLEQEGGACRRVDVGILSAIEDLCSSEDLLNRRADSRSGRGVELVGVSVVGPASVRLVCDNSEGDFIRWLN